MKIGLLGLQGAFLDHIVHLRALGVDSLIVKSPGGLWAVDRLIIPGGESTVMGKYLFDFHMLDPLRKRVREGMPVWGICAGSILLAETVGVGPGIIGGLPVHAERNAYGRQKESSLASIDIPLLNRKRYPALFIRAPRLSSAGNGLKVHATRGPDPVFVQHDRVMATTFHPELGDDPVFHDYFLGFPARIAKPLLPAGVL